jgi:hypothetical protein
MRGNPDGSLSSPGALRARGCSLSGIRMGFVLDEFLQATNGSGEDKVMAGGTPANPATLVKTPYMPSIVRARRAMEMATLVSGSSSCRPVRAWIRSTR